MLVVEKFGGSSLADDEKLRAAAGILIREAQRGRQVAAVVSARGKTTDALLAMAPAGASDRERDALLAAGEQMSAALLAMELQRQGAPAVSLTGIQAGIMTDGVYGNARVTGLGNDRIRRELARGKIVVAAGFQGLGPEGDVVTLGRGGSDTTAVALAAFLGAALCRIYTDVDGVYDRDPRLAADARRFDRIGYEQMLLLCRSGARVLHDRSVELAKAYGVRIEVCEAFGSGPGTVVG